MQARAIEGQLPERPGMAQECLGFAHGHDAALGVGTPAWSNGQHGIAAGQVGRGPGIVTGQIDPDGMAGKGIAGRGGRFQDAGNAAKGDAAVLAHQGGPALADHAIAGADNAGDFGADGVRGENQRAPAGALDGNCGNQFDGA